MTGLLDARLPGVKLTAKQEQEMVHKSAKRAAFLRGVNPCRWFAHVTHLTRSTDVTLLPALPEFKIV